MTLYLDCNASNLVDARVLDWMVDCYRDSFGNAGSPHAIGQRAKDVVHRARDQIATVVGGKRHEIVFTSGATESNNLAILGLESHGLAVGKRHLVSTAIEHHAVIEPIQQLERRGFEVTWIQPDADGRVSSTKVLQSIRPDTLLASVMHVNNETGIVQPIGQIAAGLEENPQFEPVWFHVDAAQGFTKELDSLRHRRIDMISVSGHKVHGPQGIGALIARRRTGTLPPLRPLHHGGGQELGLRPGTLPVALIGGFGLAAELALGELESRNQRCQLIRQQLLEGLACLEPTLHGDQSACLPHVVNLSFPGWDSQRVIEALWGIAAVSDGAACTSICASPSHVLTAMGIPSSCIDGSVRISWSAQTELSEIDQTVQQIATHLKQAPIF